MNIVFVTTSYPLRGSPASGVFVGQLTRALKERGHEVTVITPANKENHQDVDVFTVKYAPAIFRNLAHSAGGIPERLRESRLNFILLASMVVLLMKAVWGRLRQADIVVANWSLCGVVAGVVCLVRDVPVITVLRGSDVNLASRGIGRLMLKTSLILSDSVVCVSPSIGAILSEKFDWAKHKIQVIENGVGVEKKSSIPVKFEKGKEPKLIFVGNLTQNKGVEVIFDALLALYRSGFRFGMRFVGGGDLGHFKEKARESELEDIIEFTGGVEHSIAMDYLAVADVFVNASFAEGRSNAMLEALYLGVPVVASNIEPNFDLLRGGEWGALYPPGKADALADELRHIFLSPDVALDRAHRAAEELRKGESSWMRCAEQYEMLFNRFLC